MYAIIKTGGKQYRVTEGQILKVEKLAADVGGKVTFDDVLLVAADGGDIRMGTPFVEKASVTAEVLGQARADKIDIIKFKRRKHHMKHQGHRQYFTEIKITGVTLDGKKLAAPAKKAAPKKSTAKKTKTTTIKKVAKKPAAKTKTKAAAKKATTAKKTTKKAATKKKS